MLDSSGEGSGMQAGIPKFRTLLNSDRPGGRETQRHPQVALTLDRSILNVSLPASFGPAGLSPTGLQPLPLRPPG